MISLDDLEAKSAATTTVTEGMFSCEVRRLTPLHFEAVTGEGRAAATAEPPKFLDLNKPEHEQAWRVQCVTQAIAAAAVVSWVGIKEDCTPENVVRMIASAPDKLALKIYTAAKPLFDPNNAEGKDAGNA